MKTKPWLLLTAIALLLFVSAASAASEQAQLNPQEQKIIDYLVKDWGQDFSITSVDIAMNAVKVAPLDETRFRIGSYIKAHPELHEVIRRWGWVTLVLTPDEKLIARAIVNAACNKKSVPAIAQIARQVGIRQREAKAAVGTLERYEILKRDKSA